MRFDEAIYAHFLKQRRARFANNATQIADCKIVSVGNITTGGTGKTPTVQWIARRLQQCGARVAVVTRGYGGELSQRGAVISDGERVLVSAKEAGDEAILHARALPKVPVVIGRDRVAAVRCAVEWFAPEIVILDDGFQFWSLARDFDLVLLDARRPFGNTHLLPRGRLREEPKSLRRAHAILLTRCDAANESELKATIKSVRAQTRVPIYHSQHAPTSLRNESQIDNINRVLDVSRLRGGKVAALSAIADNDGFVRSLQSLGAERVACCARRDHHAWREKEVRGFVLEAQSQGAQCVVTTEKDAVKLHANWFEPLPLWSLCIELQVRESDELMAQLLAALS